MFLALFSLTFQGCDTGEDLEDVTAENLVERDDIFSEGSSYIAVIGDIQEYTGSKTKLEYLYHTNSWVKSQQQYFNVFSCVLQNGDLTNNNKESQWQRVDNAIKYLGDDILFIPSTGNHDYDWGGPTSKSEITDRNSTHLNELQNLENLRNQAIQRYETNKLDNIIVPVKNGKGILYIIALEFGPRKEAVSWADSIVRANPAEKYILMTHEWMSSKGVRVDKNCYAVSQMPNISHSTPEEIWKKMVYPNNNIICVLCGHNGFCKYLFSENAAGREVCQILFNLQYQANGGDGMIQLWEFPSDENVINISVYNTITREFHSDPETRVTVQL